MNKPPPETFTVYDLHGFEVGDTVRVTGLKRSIFQRMMFWKKDTFVVTKVGKHTFSGERI